MSRDLVDVFLSKKGFDRMKKNIVRYNPGGEATRGMGREEEGNGGSKPNLNEGEREGMRGNQKGKGKRGCGGEPGGGG